MHETTKLNIEKMNEKYRFAASKGCKEVKLEPGDLVWLHLRKERFPELRKSKLMSRAVSYPVFMPKPSTHRMHDPGSNVPHIRPKVLTDNQMS
jgi:hypothetical protein